MFEQHDLFTSGAEGYHTFRIPAIIVTRTGAVLAFCEGRRLSASDTGEIDLLVRRSEDSGATWSQTQLVWHDDANTCDNPCPVVDAETGIIHLTFEVLPEGLSFRGVVHLLVGRRTQVFPDQILDLVAHDRVLHNLGQGRFAVHLQDHFDLEEA